MAYPMSATTIEQALADVAELYLGVGEVMAKRGPKNGVADEGGYWPDVKDTADALDIMIQGMELVGMVPGKDTGISLDIAASQFYGNSRYTVGERDYSTQEWIAYLVTSAERITAAAGAREVDSVLVKVNQTGTVSGGARAVAAARQADLSVIVSARSGETEDVSVAHLAVGWNADIVKLGSITRGERTAKWNELIRINEELGGLPLAPVVSK